VTPEDAYSELVRLSRDKRVLSSCYELLQWDAEIYMPRDGVGHRSDQMGLVAGLVHDRATNPRNDELLSLIEGSSLVSDPESPAAVNVREIRREFDRERRKPRRLVEEWASVTALASQAWAEARTNDDFKAFAPWIERIFALAREKADAVGWVEERYDGLLEDFEPGMTTGRIAPMFTKLEADLVPLVASLREKSPLAANDVLTREFPVEGQRVFDEGVAAAIGFNMESGRLDIAQHPFCTMIGPGDVRIGIRYFPNNFTRGLFALLHECGHALYDLGLDSEHYGTPMGEPVSLGIHESQSRLWENYVGRSLGFWRHFYPQLQDAFPGALKDISLEQFRKAINRVKPGFIRIEADEVTYNLHVMNRFDLERALLSGDLRADDLPGAWSELYERRLGITPPDDRTGCLQDIHWADGLIAYFPTYTLGNVYAAQLFAAADAEIGPLEEAFSAGDFGTLREWLAKNVYRHGQRYLAPALIERATGNSPDPSALIASLSRRYRTAG